MLLRLRTCLLLLAAIATQGVSAQQTIRLRKYHSIHLQRAFPLHINFWNKTESYKNFKVVVK